MTAKTKTQAIAEFLSTQECKLDLYNPKFETQVNVIPGPQSTNSKRKLIWNDDNYEWSSFRIPFKGAGANAQPYYKDSLLEWPMETYAEAIGLTGWDWQNRLSHWVGFDFDSIVNHQVGLTEYELDAIRLAVRDIPFVTLRRSKSGKGYHLYVNFDVPIVTQNHTEHAALAKAILSNLSGMIGFNFEDKVDACGGVLWIWHRDASKENRSFETIKEATENLKVVPKNWKALVAKKKTHSRSMKDLLSSIKLEDLEEDHRTLIKYLAEKHTGSWWDAELGMLITHTSCLKDAHFELSLKGKFDTVSQGSEEIDHNCFCFPSKGGAWRVFRYTPGTKEHPLWTITAQGWTSTHFNRYPDLYMASSVGDGIKTAKGQYRFSVVEKAIKAMALFDVVVDLPDNVYDRPAQLTPGKAEGEIVFSFKYEENDENMLGWYTEGRPKRWERVFTVYTEVQQVEPPDKTVRHVNVRGSRPSWYVRSRERWNEKSKDDVRSALLPLGYTKPEIDNLLGVAILEAWDEVVKPFQVEYPGNREWNRNSPQLAYEPSPGKHEHWDMILDHIGKNLHTHSSEWCRVHGVNSGPEYLLLWVASLFRHPDQPLPYLFLFSPEQNTGKSILHEALELLFRDSIGYTRADQALANPNGFNGELLNAVLCVVEEIDVSSHKYAAERMKDWVTSPKIYVRALHKDGFNTKNYTHWIQCANNETYCPVFSGDTRILPIFISPLEEEIPKPQMLSLLQNEAAAFLHTLMEIDIPPSDSRLRIPVVNTDTKEEIIDNNRDVLLEFIQESCEYRPGWVTPLSSFIKAFMDVLPKEQQLDYDEATIKKSIPITKYVRGRYSSSMAFGNMYVSDKVSYKVSSSPLVKEGRNVKVHQ